MLELRNIVKTFGQTVVLDGISARFEAGTVTAIVGDNGAGKSTLLKAIAGMHGLDSGDILLEDEAVTRSPVQVRRQQGIEMIYQDLALAWQQSVLANLFLGREAVVPGFGLLKRGHMARRAAEGLKELGIDLPDLHKQVGLLSGGQQQAVAIARATLFQPKVLLLDEPTAALGAGQVDRVLAEIRREKARGCTLILVSHRFNDVFAVADRIVVMKHGMIASDLVVDETSIEETVQRIVS
jgi:ABC-type sugar transport system ATPase subunit